MASRGNAYLYNIATETWTDLSTTPGTPITSLAASSRFGVSVALNDTYALIGATGVSSFRGEAYLYRLDGSDAFTSTCATTGTLTSPWCTLSDTPDEPITSLAGSSNFGSSVALNDTYALIGAMEYHQTEETPISTALMAQTPSPPPAPPLAPLLHHGVPSPTPQTNQSPPLLLDSSSAPPSPSTTPMPSSVPREYHQAEETPISTALMAQTPLPPPVLPPAPLLHHGVPSLNQQTNQYPLLVTPLRHLRRPQRHLCPHRCKGSIQTEEKPISTALMAQTPLPPPAPPPAPLLHHGVPSLDHPRRTNHLPC